MHDFSIFKENLTNHALIFARLDDKRKLLETLRKFTKILKNFLMKIDKMYFLAYFQKL